MDPATSKFHSARPYAVLSVSPTLAALYATSTKNSDWCPKCGFYLLNGGADIRIVRTKKQRALQTICRGCQWKLLVPVQIEETPLHHTPLDDHLTSSPAQTPPTSAPPPSQFPASAPESSVQTKARNKKKSGLQLLLEKNREKEAQECKRKEASGGLAAFLSGL